MPTYVVFTKNNARIIKSDKGTLAFKEPFLVNPDLSSVSGVPPHYWKLLGDVVAPMNALEKGIRDIQLKGGAVNSVTYDLTQIKANRSKRFLNVASKVLLSLLALSTVGYLVFINLNS